MSTYVTGIHGLDELIGEIKPRTMILIAGHPGAGKTTFASYICYMNTRRGSRCLYITFYEDKDKLYGNLGKLGINLLEAETKGLLQYVKLPVISTEEILKTISELLNKETYEVLVIDSINPVLELTRQREEQRAILLNFFYQLLNVINGVLITVAEVPLGKESLELGSIEFVSDVIIYLKHRVINGLVTRMVEVRKIRGEPLLLTEIPFSINESSGIQVHVTPRPRRILNKGDKVFNTTVSIISELAGPIHGGDVFYIGYPSRGRPPLVIIPLIDLSITNNAKTLFISFKYSPNETRDLFILASRNYLGIDEDTTRRILDKYFHIEAFNPVGLPLPHLYAHLMELINTMNPEIVAFHGDEVFFSIPKDLMEFWTMYVNLLVWLKNMGKLVVRYSARVDTRWTRMYEALSDIIVHVYYKREGMSLKPIFYVWRRGEMPKLFEYTEKDLEKASIEAMKLAELIRLKA